jgi:hypothetical protein
MHFLDSDSLDRVNLERDEISQSLHSRGWPGCAAAAAAALMSVNIFTLLMPRSIESIIPGSSC